MPHTLHFDARMIASSGIGRYIRNILPAMTATFPMTVHGVPDQVMTCPGIGRCRVVASTAPIYSLREQWGFSRSTTDTGAFWSPHFNIPLAHRGKLIVTIHDLFHLAMPEYVHGFARRAYARLMFRAIRQKAAAIICVSEFTRRELERLTGRYDQEVTVIHEGVEEGWFHLRPGESPHPRPYLLFVGNVKPHKNLARLVEAFLHLTGEIPHDLVIVGKKEGFITGDAAVEAAARSAGDRISFTGFLPEGVLQQYYLYAAALVLPSLYEGFGFPPLEAMACGTPSVVSRTASLPEICGDAAHYFDPRDPADIARKIMDVVTNRDLASRLRIRGRQQARNYSWERTAAATRAVLERVLKP